MIDQSLERNYVVSKLRKDLPNLMESWAARSASFRVDSDVLLDQPYGKDPREKIDIFYCGKSHAALLIYLHGGYWQRGDKSIYSFIAKPFIEQGVNVALVGYPLCPQVSLTELVNSIRKALVFLFNNADGLGINHNRFNICGNSAGGHLVAMMMATHWSEIASSLPNNLIKFGVPLSALYDLEPLRYTSLNDAIRLNEEEVIANSPLLLQPECNSPILAAVGDKETPVFLAQMDAFILSWQSNDISIEQHVVNNADHFDMIARLGEAKSDLFQKIFSRLR